MSNKKMRGQNKKIGKQAENGFTMIEAIIAVFILTIGLVGTMATVVYALEFGSISRNVGSAKSIIVATIEEVETLRNAQRLNFRQIANVGKVDNTDSSNVFGGFSNGFKPLTTNPGPDGVNGTDDDLIAKGADGIYGTPDDFVDTSQVRSGYSRQITVSFVGASTSLKKIEIRVKYLGRAGKQGEITGVSYLNDDSRVNK